MLKKYFAGVKRLTKFILRREAVTAAVWVGVLLIMTAAVGAAFGGLFSAEADIFSMEMMMRNPAMIAMLGPLYALEPSTVEIVYDALGNAASAYRLTTTTGGLFTNSMLLFSAMAVCVMNIFLVARNTRSDEEKGREELILSLPVGRLSNLSAAMAAAVIINTALALTVGLGLGFATWGIESMDFCGAMLYGAALGAIGLLFAGIAAVFCQICQSSVASIGGSLAAMGFFYLLRVPGDMAEAAGNASGGLAMVSPLGLLMRTRIYAGNIFWPVSVVLLLFAGFTACAFYFNATRDLDQGLIPAKKGRRAASMLLKTPEGLAFRLLRNSFIIWSSLFFILGIAYGAVLGDIAGFLEGNELLGLMFSIEGAELEKGFVATIFSIMAVLAAVPAEHAVLKPFYEEKNHRYENILSKAVSRSRILTGYLIIALIKSAVMIFCLAFGMFLAAAAVMGNPIPFSEMMAAAFVYLPAMWAAVGVAAFAGGIFTKHASAIAYGYLGFSLALTYLGPMILQDAYQYLRFLSPFGYIPKLLIEPELLFTAFIPTIVILFIAAAFTAAGYIGYRRRDYGV